MASLVNRGSIGQSAFEWQIRVYADDLRVEHRLSISFVERGKHLLLNTYLDQPVEVWKVGGMVEEHDRKPDGRMRPFHGWVMGEAAGATLGLVSADVVAARMDARCLSLLLLRAPVDGRGLNGNAESGFHTLGWSLIPSAGGDLEKMRSEWIGLMQRPQMMDFYEGMNRPAWGNQPPRHLHEANERRAMRDGQMQHLREAPEGIERQEGRT
jgi:hypothetical protein